MLPTINSGCNLTSSHHCYSLTESQHHLSPISSPLEILSSLLTLNIVCLYMTTSKCTPLTGPAFPRTVQHLYMSIRGLTGKSNFTCTNLNSLSSSSIQLSRSFPHFSKQDLCPSTGSDQNLKYLSVSLCLSLTLSHLSHSLSSFLLLLLPHPTPHPSNPPANPPGSTFKVNPNSNSHPLFYATLAHHFLRQA